MTSLFKRLNQKAANSKFGSKPTIQKFSVITGSWGEEGVRERRPPKGDRAVRSAYLRTEPLITACVYPPPPYGGPRAPATVQLWAESQSMFTRTFLFEPPLNHAEWVLMTVFRPLIYLVTKSFHVPTVFWIIVEPGSYVRRPTAPISVNCFGGNLNGSECVWEKGNSIRCCSSSVLQTISSFFSWWYSFILQLFFK